MGESWHLAHHTLAIHSLLDGTHELELILNERGSIRLVEHANIVQHI